MVDKDLPSVLEALDSLGQGASFVLGHNVIDHDLPILKQQAPTLALHQLPVIATLDELDEAALIQILTEPKNALTKQYGKLFEMEGVDLEFRPDALKAVARRALERKTGARGLRSILEGVLLDTMYEIPSQNEVSKVVIDESVIEGASKPLLIYENSEQPAKAAPDA